MRVTRLVSEKMLLQQSDFIHGLCMVDYDDSPVRFAGWSHTPSSPGKSNTRGCIFRVHNVGNVSQPLAVQFEL